MKSVYDNGNDEEEVVVAVCTPTIRRTLKIHYGGKFVEEPRYMFKGGTVIFFKNMDVDTCSLMTFQDIAGILGCDPNTKFWFRDPHLKYKYSFHLLEVEGDITAMFGMYDSSQEIPVYFDESESALGKLTSSGKLVDVTENFDTANLDPALMSAIDKKKKKRSTSANYYTPKEFEDLQEAAYKFNDDLCDGVKHIWHIVEELSDNTTEYNSEDSSYDKEDYQVVVYKGVGQHKHFDDISVKPESKVGGNVNTGHVHGGASEEEGDEFEDTIYEGAIEEDVEGEYGEAVHEEFDGENWEGDHEDAPFVEEWDSDEGVHEEAPSVEEWDTDEGVHEEAAHVQPSVQQENDEVDDETLSTDDEFNEKKFDDDYRRPFIQCESDDENHEDGQRRRPWTRGVKTWDINSDMYKIQLRLGDIFENGEIFRLVIKNYCAEQHFEHGYTRNEKWDMGVICRVPGCPFYIWASRVRGTDQLSIKTFVPEHNCASVDDNRSVTYDVIARRYLKYIREHKEVDIEDFASHIAGDCGLYPSNHKLYRAVKRGKELLQGDARAQYGKLQTYVSKLLDSNPGSRVVIKLEPVIQNPKAPPISRFQRLYLRFAAQKEGFVAGCRPIIGLDGCHMKGYYGGQLLSAVARDANDGMFPLALALVEQENKETWGWFLHQFMADFGHSDENFWVFISDKQKGLVEIFNTEYPKVEHRYCMRHLYENWYKSFKEDELTAQLWACASATSAADLEDELITLTAMNPEAGAWLRSRPSQGWCKAYFTPRAKSSCHTNSLSECFNSWITKGRHLPIMSFLEYYRKKLMKRFTKQMGFISKHTHLLCPQIKETLVLHELESRDCTAIHSGKGIYDVSDRFDTYKVSITAETCTCMEWQLNGIPCKHGYAALVRERRKAIDYVDRYYHTQTFKQIWGGQILPVPGMKKCRTMGNDEVGLLPPIIHKPPGRPKKRRNKGVTEKKKKAAGIPPADPTVLPQTRGLVTCGTCGTEGHNSRSCTPKDYGVTAAEKKKRQHPSTGKPYSIPVDPEQAAQSVFQKQEARIKKLAVQAEKKRMKRMKKGPSTCTPEEAQREATNQAAHDVRFRTKRQKLAVVRKLVKDISCQFNAMHTETETQDVHINTEFPSEGLAKAVLLRENQLKQKYFKTIGSASSSRFSQEALFVNPSPPTTASSTLVDVPITIAGGGKKKTPARKTENGEGSTQGSSRAEFSDTPPTNQS